MIRITKDVFQYSKTSVPSKKERFKVAILPDALNVRTWAGIEHKTCSFTPLYQATIVSVCDAILSKDNKTWYYICYNKKYGFISARYTKRLSNEEYVFLHTLEKINAYVAQYSKYFYYHYDGTLDTFKEMKQRVEKKKKVGLTCLVPMKLAFNSAGVTRKDGKSLIIGFKGSFAATFNGPFTKYLKRITNNKAIGKTVREAVDNNLLSIGDTLCFAHTTHTFTYTGRDYMMYDGGHGAMKNDKYTGIIVDYRRDTRKISEILRWK